jgi:hypothetical protein
VRRKERPNFDQIVSRLQGDIGDEIKRKEEPKIVLYSKEDDLIYRNRIGKEDEIEDSDEEEEGRKGTKRGDVVSKGEYEKALAAKDKVLDELKAKVKRVEAKEKAAKDEAMRELLEKMKKERERADEEKERLVSEMSALKKKLEEKEGADVDAEIRALLEAGGGEAVAEGEAGEDVDEEIKKLLGLE